MLIVVGRDLLIKGRINNGMTGVSTGIRMGESEGSLEMALET